MSVWVCSKRQITLMSHPVESCCDYSKECSRDGGGCDAVEYAEVKKPCKWTVDGDGVWYTECGNAFVFDTGGPADNKFKVCPYCGGALMEEKG